MTSPTGGSTRSGNRTLDAVVIGAGQAGLATSYYLRRCAVGFVILDDQDAPGGAWQHTWPSLTLFSTSAFSSLPGRQMPPYDGYPPASHVIDYLTDYEHRYDLPIRRPVRVERVSWQAGEYVVWATTPDGPAHWRARHVVSATGTWSRPFVPYYPGTFAGQMWHSAHYPGVDPFRGTHVAVVGGANSAAQIVAELTEVAQVTWYVQQPPRWMPDEIDGVDLFRRSSVRARAVARGEPDPGPSDSLGDIVMVPPVRQARDQGRMEWTPMFTSLSQVGADHLIWCTGFRPALGHLREVLHGRVPIHPRLHLVGYGDWTGPGSATLLGVGPTAREAADKVCADPCDATP